MPRHAEASPYPVRTAAVGFSAWPTGPGCSLCRLPAAFAGVREISVHGGRRGIVRMRVSNERARIALMRVGNERALRGAYTPVRGRTNGALAADACWSSLTSGWDQFPYPGETPAALTVRRRDVVSG